MIAPVSRPWESPIFVWEKSQKNNNDPNFATQRNAKVTQEANVQTVDAEAIEITAEETSGNNGTLNPLNATKDSSTIIEINSAAIFLRNVSI